MLHGPFALLMLSDPQLRNHVGVMEQDIRIVIQMTKQRTARSDLGRHSR
jgi:hypothetical protein